MSNDLKILISAKMDDSQQTVQNLNNQIDQLAKKLNTIILNVGLNQNSLSQFTKQIQEMRNLMEQSINAINNASNQSTKNQINNINKINNAQKSANERLMKLPVMGNEANKEIEKRIKQLNDVLKQQGIGEAAKYKAVTDSQGRLTSATIEYKNQLGQVIKEELAWQKIKYKDGKKTKNAREFQVTKTTYTDDAQKQQQQREKALNEELKIKQAINKKQEVDLKTQEKQREQVLNAELQMRQKITKEIEKQSSKLRTQVEDVKIKGALPQNKINQIINDFSSAKQTGTLKTLQDFSKKYAVELESLTPSQKKFNDEQQKLRQELIAVAKTGKYTTDELRKIGQSLNQSTNLKHLDALKTKLTNLQFGGNLEQQQDRLRQKVIELGRTGEYTERTIKRLNTMIDSSKNVAEINKIISRMQVLNNASENRKQSEKLSDFQRKAIADAESLGRTHRSTVDQNALNSYINQVKSLTATTPRLNRELQLLSMQFREISNGAKEAARSSMTLMDAFRTAMVKFPVENIHAGLKLF